jgi:hypothetical protein
MRAIEQTNEIHFARTAINASDRANDAGTPGPA